MANMQAVIMPLISRCGDNWVIIVNWDNGKRGEWNRYSDYATAKRIADALNSWK